MVVCGVALLELGAFGRSCGCDCAGCSGPFDGSGTSVLLEFGRGAGWVACGLCVVVVCAACANAWGMPPRQNASVSASSRWLIVASLIQGFSEFISSPCLKLSCRGFPLLPLPPAARYSARRCKQGRAGAAVFRRRPRGRASCECDSWRNARG